MPLRIYILSLLVYLIASQASIQPTPIVNPQPIQVDPVETTQVEPQPITSVDPISEPSPQNNIVEVMPSAIEVSPIPYDPTNSDEVPTNQQTNNDVSIQEQPTDSVEQSNTTVTEGDEELESDGTNQTENVTIQQEQEIQVPTIVVTSVQEELVASDIENQSNLTQQTNNTNQVNQSEVLNEQNDTNDQIQTNQSRQDGQNQQINETVQDNQTTNQTSNEIAQTQIQEIQVNANQEGELSTAEVITLPTTHVSGPEPTTILPNPTKDLTPEGQACLEKCRSLGGISCKKWSGIQITCCRFTGCQWPFYCNPSSRIQVEGCQNLP